jgi:predicted NACHT family NTPase
MSYMPPRLRLRQPPEREITLSEGLTNASPTSSRQTSENMLTFADLLAYGKRWVLVGGAGSGKTTFLHWLARKIAYGDLSGGLAALNRTVPFVVHLRRYPTGHLPVATELPLILQPHADPDTTWVRPLLKTGRAVLLIDAVDELPESERDDVVRYIDSIVSEFPEATVVVTARGYAVTEDWLGSQHFLHAELQPLEGPALTAFARGWHTGLRDALLDENRLTPEVEKGLALAQDRMTDTLGKRPSVRDLASTPLLCAMMCALNYELGLELPDRRLELYEQCWKMMYLTYDKERRVHLGDYVELEEEIAALTAGSLGYHMLQSKSPAQFPAKRADQKMQKCLRAFEAGRVSTQADGETTRRLLVERVQVLQEPVENELVEFTHLCFRDYLAARSVVYEEDYEPLASHACEDHWRECIVLSAGLATRRSAQRLISDLLDRADNAKNSEQARTARMTALACLETVLSCGDLVPSVTSRLICRI